ncbi:VOC family protein [Aestuariibius sp. HNIBRBA575]|uniref:SMU1112c/YaeR family gloxylase I-like metalloprotein n=1 Tax=Aestuariibius sp. HNIBRBA575 TaxID=3233343 RepID=UPI0034A2C7DC
MALNLTHIHHVALICRDYRASKHFYTQILGLPIISENYRAKRQSWKLDLKLPDSGQLELFSFPDPPARGSHPEHCGLRHLAFGVADLDHAIQHLTDANIDVEPIRIDEFTGARFTFFPDPDRLPIELYETQDGSN